MAVSSLTSVGPFPVRVFLVHLKLLLLLWGLFPWLISVPSWLPPAPWGPRCLRRKRTVVAPALPTPHFCMSWTGWALQSRARCSTCD